MFIIERSRDADVVIYEATLMEDGSLNQKMEVERIYVWFSNKSYWFPKVGRVELHTKTANTLEILAKVIIP